MNVNVKESDMTTETHPSMAGLLAALDIESIKSVFEDARDETRSPAAREMGKRLWHQLNTAHEALMSQDMYLRNLTRQVQEQADASGRGYSVVSMWIVQSAEKLAELELSLKVTVDRCQELAWLLKTLVG